MNSAFRPVVGPAKSKGPLTSTPLTPKSVGYSYLPGNTIGTLNPVPPIATFGSPSSPTIPRGIFGSSIKVGALGPITPQQSPSTVQPVATPGIVAGLFS
jgi:hypothetical protein